MGPTPSWILGNPNRQTGPCAPLGLHIASLGDGSSNEGTALRPGCKKRKSGIVGKLTKGPRFGGSALQAGTDTTPRGSPLRSPRRGLAFEIDAEKASWTIVASGDQKTRLPRC